ncbi:PBECR2 nuclease fold domain-containing protein [Caulobacter soli]|uniref:phage head morphogenesis protein n=1 Tax=Caulobacter soli TaxID=2708539 RepID=UPI0013EC885E|nr:PBECR2 nuclease fold domain-containing protein [Caulobacter soli]
MAQIELKALPPEEAIAYLRKRGGVLEETFDHRDVFGELHTRMFTVAKSIGYDMLGDVFAGLDKALAEGLTLETFRANLTPLLQAKGWWGKAIENDPVDGEDKVVQLGSPHRLRTIFDANMRTSYAAGRWERWQRTKATFPILQYLHTDQEHPRLEHKAWGDQPVILYMDDPWWTVHLGPNGWFCKCGARQLNQRMMDREGLKLTDKPIAFPPKPYTNPRTGQTIQVEGGITPGWGYNVGAAHLAGVTPEPAPTLPPAPATSPSSTTKPPIAPRPGPAILDAGVVVEEAAAAFLTRFALGPAEAKIFKDVAGEGVPIGPALFTTPAGTAATFTTAQLQAMPLAAEALAAPAEIRWVWRPAADGTNELVRRYIARLKTDGQVVDVVLEHVVGGRGRWSMASSLDAGFVLDAWREGDVAWPASGPAPGPGN